MPRLKTLDIQNFMSIRLASVTLENQGLILVQGDNQDSPAYDSNGAGKSTVFEALTWVKYGQTIRDLAADDVVNEDYGKDCAVKLSFEGDDGTPYSIERYRKHSSEKNSVKIFRSKVNITPKSAKDADRMIEEIFSMDFATFTNSILFGQGLVKMFSVASDAEKKDILERMLQVGVFRKALDLTKERRKALEQKILGHRNTLSNISVKAEQITKSITSLEKMEEEYKAKIQEELVLLNQQLVEAEDEEREYCSNSVDLGEKLQSLRQELETIESKLSYYKEVETLYNSLKMEQRDIEREYSRKQVEIERLKAEAERIASGQGELCPACGQSISEESIESSVRHIFAKIVEIREEIKETPSELEAIQKDLHTCEGVLRERVTLDSERIRLTGEISEVTTFITTEINAVKRLANRLEGLRKQIKSKEGDLEKTYRPLIEENQRELLELDAKALELEGVIGELEQKLDEVNFWVEGFGNSGVKSYLLDSVTPFLNKKANEYLGKLAGNTVQIKFSTQTRLQSGELREKFEVNILNSIGGGAYKKNSQGERRRIDLAIALALQDLVMNRGKGRLNVLVYDEIFDSLDSIGCENAIQLLQELSQRVETIFVITHNDILKSYFDRYLQVTKKNGRTIVERL